jgi:hypothetical protein
MSYDFLLFEVQPGVDSRVLVEVQFDRYLEYKREREGINFLIPTADRGFGPPQAHLEARKERLAEALIATDPSLLIERHSEPSRSAAEFLERKGINPEEWRQQHRTFVVKASDEGTGIFVYLMDTTALVGVPYWHPGTHAQRAIEDAWSYIKILQEVAGYQTYDPQREQLLDLTNDFGDVVAKYRILVGVAQRRIGDPFEWRRNVLGVDLKQQG